jgi:hypothetical protein
MIIKIMLVVARRCTPGLVSQQLQPFKHPNRTHTIARFAVVIGLAFGVVASGSPVMAQRDTAQVIEASMDAMGGRSHLKGLHSLKLDLRTVAYRIDDSEQEDGAPWLNIDVASEWRDEDAGRSRTMSPSIPKRCRGRAFELLSPRNLSSMLTEIEVSIEWDVVGPGAFAD